MDGERSGHIIFFGRFQESDQILKGGVFVMMAAGAGIRLLISAAGLQARLGRHEPEGVAACVPSLADGRRPGHVTPDATAKGMNAVGRAVLWCSMTAFAQPVLKQPGLGGDDVHKVWRLPGGCQSGPAFVDTMAGNTDHTNLGVLALLPVQVLLVAVSGFPARPKVVGVIVGTGFVEIQPYVGRTLDALVVGWIGIVPCLVPTPGVTRATYLSGRSRG